MLNSLFEIPELQQAIVERLDSPEDAGRLASVCRSLFDSCIPFAWRRVSSAIQLLKLLPGATTSENKNPWSRYYSVLELPESLTEEDFARFRFYASFVKALDMSESTASLRLLNWEWLFSYTQSQPLLPNLEILTVTRWGSSSQYDSTPIWFTLFLSPSLLTFQSGDLVSYGETYISLSGAHFILSAIADMCPRIKTLVFLPYIDVTENKILGNPNRYISYQDLGPFFSRMKHLTKVRTCIATLESIPLSLDGFLAIKRLDVTMQPSGVGLNRIPDALFSSLEHFGAFNYRSNLILILPSFVTSLTSLQLHMGYYQNDIQEVLLRVAEYNPCLLDLSMHPIRYQFSHGRSRWPLLEATTLEPLGRLTRLERFCLSNVILVLPGQDAAEALSYVGALPPGLKRLEAPHHVIPLSKLSKVVSRLPRLEYLSATITELGIAIGHLGVGQANNSALQVIEPEFERSIFRAIRTAKLNEAEVDKDIARYLSAMCMNVQIVDRPGRYSNCSPEESAAADKIITSINQLLSALALPPGLTLSRKNTARVNSQVPWQSLPTDV
ncbi:hypothetical protein FRC12_002104 [Ceratobasidium sp. 428]|nr:hypothetical protein FRC12_002104 [Ceratobasidium sp. 428]